MSNIDRTTNWEKYESGREDAEDILRLSSDVLFGVRWAIDQYADDKLLSKPGQLSYKSGYLDAVIQALKDESERAKNDILTFYVEGELEDNGRESEGNTDGDERSVDPGSEAGDI
jgi:hypothetical protein